MHFLELSWLGTSCIYAHRDFVVKSIILTHLPSLFSDVNIFFNDHDDPNHTAEIEVMIAEEAARGKRIGLTAVVLMLLYGINQFQINKYTAKIGLENKVSISLFKDKLGFSEVSKSEVFQEVTLEMAVNEDWIENVLMRFVPSYNQKKYPILE